MRATTVAPGSAATSEEMGGVWVRGNVGSFEVGSHELAPLDIRSRVLRPPSEGGDRFVQGASAIGHSVGASVVAEGQTRQHAGSLEFAKACREHARRHPQVSLKIAVALRSVEQPFHDEEGPSAPDDFQCRREVAHAV